MGSGRDTGIFPREMGLEVLCDFGHLDMGCDDSWHTPTENVHLNGTRGH